MSETGALAPLAADYRRGLLLWQEGLNAAGGLLGRRVELRLLDDESDARRSGELYAQLIRDKVDLLIGPYGSAATLMAARRRRARAARSDQRRRRRGRGPPARAALPFPDHDPERRLRRRHTGDREGRGTRELYDPRARRHAVREMADAHASAR